MDQIGKAMFQVKETLAHDSEDSIIDDGAPGKGQHQDGFTWCGLVGQAQPGAPGANISQVVLD